MLEAGGNLFELLVRDHVLESCESAGSALLDGLQHGLGAEAAVLHGEVVHDWPAHTFVLPERFGGLERRERRGQHARVDDRLRARLRADGVHRVRSVAEQRDAAAAPRGERLAVYEWEEEHVWRLLDEGRDVEPSKAPARESLKQPILVDAPVPFLRW